MILKIMRNMKKQLLLVLLAFLPLMASAEDVEIDGIYYRLASSSTNHSAYVAPTGGYISSYQGDIYIPDSVEYMGVFYQVKGICASAFYESNITSIRMPDSIIEILDWAFSGCRKLTSIEMPTQLNTIGERCFSTALDTLYIKDLSRWCKVILFQDNPLRYANHVFVDGVEISDLVLPNEIVRIWSAAFWGFSGKTVTIGDKMKKIGSNAFSNCNNLTDFYIYSEEVPEVYIDPDDRDGSFDYTDISNITLHVPSSALDKYKTTGPWRGFGHIYAIGEEPLPQCTTPTIAYANGKVRFACETEGVEFVPSITVTPNQLQNGNELAIGGTFTVSVYAVKEGYDNSDTATMTINMSQMGDVNADGELNTADITAVVNAILGK